MSVLLSVTFVPEVDGVPGSFAEFELDTMEAANEAVETIQRQMDSRADRASQVVLLKTMSGNALLRVTKIQHVKLHERRFGN